MQQPPLYVPQFNPFVNPTPVPPTPDKKGAKVKDPSGPAPMDYRMEPVGALPPQPFPPRMWS